jgi:hypothetical protein
MQLLPLRFTIRQLIGLIAVCAVTFALLRTPFGFVVVAFGFVVPGFLIERAGGGDGVIGGAVSASLIGGGLALAASPLLFSVGPEPGHALLSAFSFVLAVSLMAFVLGMILSTILYAIFKILQTLIPRPVPEESVGPIRWIRLDDGPDERR